MKYFRIKATKYTNPAESTAEDYVAPAPGYLSGDNITGEPANRIFNVLYTQLTQDVAQAALFLMHDVDTLIHQNTYLNIYNPDSIELIEVPMDEIDPKRFTVCRPWPKEDVSHLVEESAFMLKANCGAGILLAAYPYEDADGTYSQALSIQLHGYTPDNTDLEMLLFDAIRTDDRMAELFRRVLKRLSMQPQIQTPPTKIIH